MFNRKEARKIRHLRIRKKIVGSEIRPRLNLFKSNNSLYAQIIDDSKGNTIIGLSSLTFKDLKSKKNIEAATKLGHEIAKLAGDKKIKSVVFDRGGNLYHGKVKAFADAARKSGLEF
ncbi:50S ribosomal protein L18 [Spiroplasma platyhelix]|uniref:Large ribosomal subunit protein uL18 n=1 Tax=Spiroplasma platyhelix PALS-1 TaxID=1276218 RepID=A0A846U1I0_9MOLU|nr:50S ribosomal protein L18 [Spiroplasma platyhelix]MBE4704294.1 50S ribosomal protein L18 [Spiroplasma platyhelix PALS-1]NKE38666.1 50S ribosomal protein L18 [Spiroplasma platyhelix PALS-1]UJB28878.1 50S ribosomal protein L18 [Spiroplasma platyhelix PALS-1]